MQHRDFLNLENKHGDKGIGNTHKSSFFRYFEPETQEIHIGLEGREMHRIDVTRAFFMKETF
ncbi:hypothetical protein D0U04_11090 [Bacillus clarus]|uniref:Uncharacterized protein n=1 Tax=Bacillus clarus TaxID=2338372 RepID=A0A090YJW0_9BACI|nr:hypothetical protein DJ93_2085 [Bacillus clarus]RFT67009.1 hypothetical protein D0U04_11090 [Bacillus clarus]